MHQVEKFILSYRQFIFALNGQMNWCLCSHENGSKENLTRTEKINQEMESVQIEEQSPFRLMNHVHGNYRGRQGFKPATIRSMQKENT